MAEFFRRRRQQEAGTGLVLRRFEPKTDGRGLLARERRYCLHCLKQCRDAHQWIEEVIDKAPLKIGGLRDKPEVRDSLADGHVRSETRHLFIRDPCIRNLLEQGRQARSPKARVHRCTDRS
ncbi:MAG: hypothetical protein OET41_00380 [Xanthomonadales bacterium]|nr:hypothetical protein [Xanthomonadales bacterium]